MVKFLLALFMLSISLVDFTLFCLPVNKIGFAPSISLQWVTLALLLSDRIMIIKVMSFDFISPLSGNTARCYVSFAKKSLCY